MAILPDIEIARRAIPLPISTVAADLGIDEHLVVPYGHHKAKIDLRALNGGESTGKLILVTAMTPTPAGEGKTTTTVGLADSLRHIGKRAAVALREPSLGPVFGVKGGAAGGGYAQVIPMEDINLHFTGDFHAIAAANNLLAALIDNHLHHGNALNIDPKRVTWRRCLDMNDRALRSIVVGLGGGNGQTREDGFDITAASEIMAVLCLAENPDDLHQRLGRVIVACTRDGHPVTGADLKAQGAMAALLKDALKPNLVQTLEQTPAFIHGGPFANIAHGCNSVLATRLALRYADYAVTEAGFGADLGAEKFLDIKCRTAGLWPSAVVVVATVRALKLHGGVKKADLLAANPEAVVRGLPNLFRHVENIRGIYGLPVVVAINHFADDRDDELELVRRHCAGAGIDAIVSEVFAKGGQGGAALARHVVDLCEQSTAPRFCYPLEASIPEKITAIAGRVYRAGDVHFAPAALRQIKQLEQQGLDNFPVCMAKTQYSFSDSPALLCAPEGFALSVREIRVSAGAGFIVALTGDIMTLPGLPKQPASDNISLSGNEIYGLF